MRLRDLTIIATSGLLAVSLTGCFGNPVEKIVEDIVEQQTGVEVDVDTDGTGGTTVSLPEGWPGLPTPNGHLASTMSLDGTYALTYVVSSTDELENLIQQLLAQGFTETARADYGEMISATLSSAEWHATLGIIIDKDASEQVLQYTVTPVG